MLARLAVHALVAPALCVAGALVDVPAVLVAGAHVVQLLATLVVVVLFVALAPSAER